MDVGDRSPELIPNDGACVPITIGLCAVTARIPSYVWSMAQRLEGLELRLKALCQASVIQRDRVLFG
jgi:hypothetical protein